MSIEAQYNRVTSSSFVTTLSWIFIIAGGFGTLISIVQNVLLNTVFPADQIRATADAAKSLREMPQFVGLLFENFRFVFALFLCLSVATLWLAIALLKRKNWARVGFIFLMALGIVWNVGGLLLQYTLFSSTSELPGNSSPEFVSRFTLMSDAILAFSSLLTIGLCILFGWIIKRLISESIRLEFSQHL